MAKKAKAEVLAMPKPVKSESRICFGVDYFYSEEEADRYAEFICDRGDTYNGGWYHGMSCGREKRFDHKDAASGKMVYAVTTR